ncbi:MAG: hypothetical protein C0506_05180 [Anaerolinea sp.]|nr:hypothetical protein [Anaerolinea sp.]
MRWRITALVGGATLAMTVLACNAVDDRDGTVSATPGGRAKLGESALHLARLDASRQAKVEPLEVRIKSLRHAGWDSCLGFTTSATQVCRELFVGGYIARFDAGGREWRYHIAGSEWVGPVDPAKGTVNDGSPVPPEIQADLNSALAQYVRAELTQLRSRDTGGPVTAVITAIAPVGMSGSCLGFALDSNPVCTADLVPGAVVLLAASNGKTYRYHVAQSGVVATDFERGKAIVEPDPADVSLQDRMRADLAGRVKQPLASISMVAFRHVVWSDGCLGIQLPGRMCTQALVPGFYAEVADEKGEVYRYHGANGQFVNATLERGAILGPPPPAARP